MNEVFTLKLSGSNKKFDLRALNLADEIWIQENFPDYADKVTTNGIDRKILSSILFRAIEDKSQFEKRDIIKIDENGEKIDTTIGGVELLMTYIVTQDDINHCLEAFICVLQKSRPVTVEMVKKKMIVKRSIFILLSILFALGIAGLIQRLCV